MGWRAPKHPITLLCVAWFKHFHGENSTVAPPRFDLWVTESSEKKGGFSEFNKNGNRLPPTLPLWKLLSGHQVL